MININEQEKSPVTEKPKLVYIDVWPYEVSGDLALPILVHARQLIGKASKESYLKSWRRIVGVLAQAGTDIGLRKLLGLQLSDVQDYVDNLQDIAPDYKNLRDFETLIDDIRDTQDAFCELIQLASKANQNRRIVFLVDNLDRCSPENVVRLLESIKNFLHAPSCVWVFAMDSGVIASYIDHKYEGTRMDGNSYLDKIVPEQYHIPPISDQALNQLHNFLTMVRPINTEKGSLPDVDITKIPQIPEVLVPRRLLKTAHKFYEAYTGDLKTSTTADPQLVFILILLYHTWPAFYERFSSEKPEHIRGILSNFSDSGKDKTLHIPLDEKYTNDRALRHFLHLCFIHQQNLETLCITLAGCMTWLHEVGLP
jgi:KAP-like P-loop domain-containing protein